ncbi:MAG: tetratricopeptide repeat protein [Elusimicrobia bacterium]|nr:tetratricopeptide repeat protein [Elusimicrobiota bacterium]
MKYGFFIIFLATLLFAETDVWQSKKLYEEAISDIKKGNYLTAYDKLSEAYWLDPFNDDALKEMDAMTKKFKKNLAKWGYYDFLQEAYARGFLYYTQGKYKKALKEWKRILAVKENVEVRDYYEFVKKQLKKGEVKKLEFGGKAKYDREQKKKQKVKTKRAKKKEKKKEKTASKPEPQVKKPSKPKVKIDKAKADVLYNEGLKQYSQGYLKLAIETWKKALKYNPNHIRAKRAVKRAERILKEGKK